MDSKKDVIKTHVFNILGQGGGEGKKGQSQINYKLSIALGLIRSYQGESTVFAIASIVIGLKLSLFWLNTIYFL